MSISPDWRVAFLMKVLYGAGEADDPPKLGNRNPAGNVATAPGRAAPGDAEGTGETVGSGAAEGRGDGEAGSGEGCAACTAELCCTCEPSGTKAAAAANTNGKKRRAITQTSSTNRCANDAVIEVYERFEWAYHGAS